jgi:hypothetical protein
VENTDGSTISNLSGTASIHGASAGALDDSRVQTRASRLVVDNLRSGTYYFAVSAYNAPRAPKTARSWEARHSLNCAAA